MLIDVSKILKNSGESIEISGDVVLSKENSAEGVPVFKKLGFLGKVTNIGGVLELKVKASGKYSVLCSRCLKELERDFEEEFSEILVSRETADESTDDAVVFTGHEIDISEIIEANVYLFLPSVFLCSEDCKGLCQKCGKDLNEGECNCSKTELNPAFAKLLSMFDEE